jgi:hypothetical protein
MGALGTWIGALSTLQVFILSSVLVAISSIAVLIWEVGRIGVTATKRRYVSASRATAEEEERAPAAAFRQKTRRRLLPYAVPVALSTWLVMAYPFVKDYLTAQ